MTISREQAAIDNALTEMRNARSFICSQEQMHPSGIALYDDAMGRLTDASAPFPATTPEQNSAKASPGSVSAGSYVCGCDITPFCTIHGRALADAPQQGSDLRVSYSTRKR